MAADHWMLLYLISILIAVPIRHVSLRIGEDVKGVVRVVPIGFVLAPLF